MIEEIEERMEIFNSTFRVRKVKINQNVWKLTEIERLDIWDECI